MVSFVSPLLGYSIYSVMGWEWINYDELKKAELKKLEDEKEELKKEEAIIKASKFRGELMKQIKLSKLKLKPIPKLPPIKQSTPIKFKVIIPKKGASKIHK